MKRSQLFLAVLALPLDYLALFLAGLSAYFLRFESFITDIRPIRFYLPLENYLGLLLLVALIWLLFLAIAGLYQTNTRLKFYEEIRRVFLACSTGLALIIVWFFFNQNLFSSRFIVLAFWVLAVIFISLGRWLLRLLRNTLYRRGVALSKVLIIGTDHNTKALVKLFQESPTLGYRVVASLPGFTSESVSQYLGSLDEVLVSDTKRTPDERLAIWEYCNEHHLGFKYVADVFNTQIHNVVIHTLAGLPIVEIRKTPLDGWGRISKRLFDLACSLILLILLAPVLLLVALIIKLKDGSPVIVELIRVGERGQYFTLHKFRTMVPDAHKMKPDLWTLNERADGPLFKLTNDPRVTSWGKFLRKWSLDELPQFFDVLAGRMSLVGPRPHEPEEVLKYTKDHKKLLNIKPGITGLAQISGRSSLTFADEAKLDSFYIENWSLFQDLLILIKTIYVVLQRKDAV